MKFIFILILFLIPFYSYAKEIDRLIFASADTKLKGIKKVLVTAYEKIGIEVEIKLIHSKRSILLADEGRIDGEFGRSTIIEQEYKNLLRVPFVLLLREIHFFTKDTIIDDFTKDNIKKYRVGIINGHKYAEKFTKDFLNVISVKNTKQLIGLLVKNRVDITIDFPSSFETDVALMGLNSNDFKYKEQDFKILKRYHYLHKKHNLLIPKITQSLNQMKQNGEMERILKRYIVK